MRPTIFDPFWLHFGIQVGATLASEIAPWPPQMRPKTHLGARIRPDPLQTSFLIDFWWILGRLGPILAPSWLHFGASWPHLGLILESLGLDFGRFGAPFWKFLLCDVVALLLCYFGTLLLSSWRGGGVAALLRCWIIEKFVCIVLYYIKK